MQYKNPSGNLQSLYPTCPRMTSSLNSFFTPAAMKDLVLGVGIVAPISTWSGITPASTAALGNTLRKDYEKWHIFYDDGNSCHK